MKIVLIGTTSASVIRFRRDLILSLGKQGHVVYCFALDYDDESRKAVVSLGGVPVDYSFSRSGLNPVLDLWNTLKLAKLLRHLEIDLVFSYFVKPVIFGSLAAFWAGVPRVVAMLEGLGFVFTPQPKGVTFKTKCLQKVQTFLYKYVLPKLDRMIFLNHDDPNDLLVANFIKVRQVSVLGGIGLNLSDYPLAPVKLSPIRFLFIGRLLAEKGIFEFLEAAKQVKEEYPEAQFCVLGGLDLDNPGGLTQEQLDEVVQSGVVIYPGHVSNVYDWIADSSVFVLPSYREGVPRSTQEAMAIGRAVITTDVPGCRDTVVDGVNGFLVPPWNVTALTQKMFYFIENPNEILNMGLKGHEMAIEKFDANLVNQRLVKMLLEEGVF